jgi:hypothetical protein
MEAQKKLNIWKHNKLQNNTASKERYTSDMDAGSTNCIEIFEKKHMQTGCTDQRKPYATYVKKPGTIFAFKTTYGTFNI